MSANNQIIIRKKGKKFIASDMDTGTGKDWCVIAKTDTLEEAIKKANKYQKENMVEYGMHIAI